MGIYNYCGVMVHNFTLNKMQSQVFLFETFQKVSDIIYIYIYIYKRALRLLMYTLLHL